MRLSRPSRFIAVMLAVISVLFTQLAMAAYACPGMPVAQAMGMAMTTAAEAVHAMPDCDEMDLEQPALCHAHMQAADQSLDKPVSPSVLPFVAVLLVQAISVLHTASPSLDPYAEPAWLRRSFEPPLAIRNCCFRI